MMPSRLSLAQQAPPPARWESFLPPLKRRELGSGLTLLLAENPTVPVIQLSWLTWAGARLDEVGRRGTAALLASSRTAGTAKSDAAQLMKRANALGTDLLTGMDWDVSYLAVSLLVEDLDEGAELLAELAAEPAFPPRALEELKRYQLAQLKRRPFIPSALADDTFARALHGTRFGGSPLGVLDDLPAITRKDVQQLHQVSAAGVLLAVGCFQAPDLLPRLEKAFEQAGRSGRPIPLPDSASRTRSEIPTTILVDAPQSLQTELRIGQPSVTRSHPDFDRLQVLNTVLGGTANSRLQRRLRESLGLTYHVSSEFQTRFDQGAFRISAAIDSAGLTRAVEAIEEEIERLQNEPVPSDELDGIKRHLIGLYPRRYQTDSGTALEAVQTALHDLPVNAGERFLEAVAKVEPTDLIALARSSWRAEERITVAVGPAETLRPQLVSRSGQISQISDMEGSSW